MTWQDIFICFFFKEKLPLGKRLNLNLNARLRFFDSIFKFFLTIYVCKFVKIVLFFHGKRYKNIYKKVQH